jgi:membrane protease YdiL (CAAX protease family)
MATTQLISNAQPESKTRSLRLSLFTWAVVLLVSDLTDALWQALIGEPPTWLFWMKASLLMVIILLSLTWKPIKIVRPFFILLLVLILALEGMGRLMETAAYDQWQNQVGWVGAMAGFQLIKMAVSVIMVGVLLLMGKRWKDFFFTGGQFSAPIREAKSTEQPGKNRLTWGSLGLILGVCIAPLTLLFFGLGNLPSGEILRRALPYLPLVFLFAATNAFSEETQFRAALLGDAQNIVGAGQAVWLTAAFFGFAHYFGGSPSGIPGVLITGLLGALFAWSMQGSKGIVVPWFIHFGQNVVIYAFWAIGAVS